MTEDVLQIDFMNQLKKKDKQLKSTNNRRETLENTIKIIGQLQAMDYNSIHKITIFLTQILYT